MTRLGRAGAFAPRPAGRSASRLGGRRFALALTLALLAALPEAGRAFTVEEIWHAWPAERFVPTAAPCLRHAEVVERLEALAAAHPGVIRLDTVGHSVQRRSIHRLTLGRGAREVILWSQMHGDEPSATPALLDLADWLARHADETDVARIFAELTLRIVPMLNPDGAELYVRRNAQGIDINRDALNLATPEGRLLRELRDRHEPVLGFNLHDQNRRRTVGDTGVLATTAVLAVAGDAAGTITPGRERARRAGVAVATALAPYAPGGLSRYDDDWSPRAFGDDLTARGTPVLLLESGGVLPGFSLERLTQLAFVAILAVLRDLAQDDLAGHDSAAYERIPENESDVWGDIVVRGGRILQPGAGMPYRADLAFEVARPDRAAAGCEPLRGRRSAIVEVGDARFFAAGRTVEASGKMLVAPFEAGIDGWGAAAWLDPGALERLGRLGIARLVWKVPGRRLVEAERLVARLAGVGRPPVEILSHAERLPPVVLDRLPAAARTKSLGERLDALFAARALGRSGGGDEVARLEALWNAAWGGGRPPLRPGAPASFLVVAGGDLGGSGLEGARVEAIWLEGSEVWRNGE